MNVILQMMIYLILIFHSGIPAVLYGVAAIFLITHEETVFTAKGNVQIYFLLKENKDSMY